MHELLKVNSPKDLGGSGKDQQRYCLLPNLGKRLDTRTKTYGRQSHLILRGFLTKNIDLVHTRGGDPS